MNLLKTEYTTHVWIRNECNAMKATDNEDLNNITKNEMSYIKTEIPQIMDYLLNNSRTLSFIEEWSKNQYIVT